MDQHQIAIVGGGVVGLATALACAERGLGAVVIEAEPRVASHQTGHNSGVIHSGLYYKPGSLKAKLCAEGRERMYDFCSRHSVPHERCGKVVVATEASQMKTLEMLAERGTANGLKDVRVLPIEQVRHREPNVAGVAGLIVQETGIVDYTAVANAMVRQIRQLGGDVRTTTRLLGVRQEHDSVVLRTSGDEIRAKLLINCAGLHSDRVAMMCGVRPAVRIVPFRGEYHQLGPRGRSLVRDLIYPVPDPQFPFLGVHFTRMVGGGVEAGPNAVLAFARHGYRRRDMSLRDLASAIGFPGFWRMAKQHWRMGLAEMRGSLSRRTMLRGLQKLVPQIELDDLLPGGSGVRAQALQPDGKLCDDFVIQQSPRMIHVLNAPSPAATASLAIGSYIAALVKLR